MEWCIFSLFLSYLLGSIPTAYLLTRWFLNKDIRTIGSGNIGTTNAFRTGHKLLGILTFLSDAGKGMLAVTLTLWMMAGSPLQNFMGMMSLFLVIIGHIFPVWLKFKGGKGVAPFAGGCLILFPGVTLCTLGVWGLTFFIKRISSLSSLVAVGLAPLFLWYFEPSFIISPPYRQGKLSLFLLCCFLIILKHTSNIRRLFLKKESSFSIKTTPQTKKSQKIQNRKI